MSDNPARLSLRRRIALEAARKLRKMKAAEPQLRQLFWESTNRCNVNCLHCGSDCTAGTGIADMPAEDFLRVIDSISPHIDTRNCMVIISGGEPLVRSDLEDVGRELYRREYPWGIVTNGYALTPDRLDSLLRAGMHSASVSIDGLEADHDWLRQRPGSWKRAMAALAALAKRDAIPFDAITCVNSRNIGDLPHLKSLLAEAGVGRWRLFTIFPSGRAADNDDLSLSPEQYRSLLRFIAETRRQGDIAASYCCEGFLGAYEGEVRDHFFDCQAGISVASILIDGSISGCASIRSDYVEGNIYRDDFMTVWRERYRRYRDRSWMRTGECGDCRFWRYCVGNGMHLRRSDGSLARCNLHDLCR